MPRLVHVIPQRQYFKDGMVFNLRTARTDHECDKCGHPIDTGTDYYSATDLHSELGRIVVPDMYHVECVDNLIDGGETNGRSNQPDA